MSEASTRNFVVKIKTPEEMVKLGEEMRKDAAFEPVEERPDYEWLDTEDKVIEEGRIQQEQDKIVPRFISVPP